MADACIFAFAGSPLSNAIAARGSTPHAGAHAPAARPSSDASVRQPGGPNIVCVLPLPVCPYASSVQLNPSVSFLSSLAATASKQARWSLPVTMSEAYVCCEEPAMVTPELSTVIELVSAAAGGRTRTATWMVQAMATRPQHTRLRSARRREQSDVTAEGYKYLATLLPSPTFHVAAAYRASACAPRRSSRSTGSCRCRWTILLLVAS